MAATAAAVRVTEPSDGFCLSAASASAPNAAHKHLLRYARQRAWCEWEDFGHWPYRILADLDDPAAPVWPPFHLLSLSEISAADQRRCAERWLGPRLALTADARQATQAGWRDPASRPDPATAPQNPGAAAAAPDPAPRRLRIGYLSSDFHQHATALLMIDMLEAHDRHRFQLHAYSHGPGSDGPMRQRLHAVFTRFHDIRDLDDDQAARLIHADGIDILVDLKGYTAGSRSMLLAWRAAPVQVSYLGYPGTLGQTCVDYLISDRRVTPEAAAADYQEALACMPHSYQPHAPYRTAAGLVPDRPGARQAAGLPPDALVLCCFNQAWKLSPEVFDVWCRILRRLPGSVLWLLEDERARGNLRNEALARGVEPQRLVFATDAAQAEHLARLPLADLMLDTWPYNAHTTASDALAAGVPLVTLQGHTFAGRVAQSLLHAVGLPELVMPSVADYEAQVVALGSQPAALARLRERLVRLSPAAPLFDAPGYARHLGELYQRMWARHQAGLAPQAIDLERPPVAVSPTNP